MKFVVLIGDGMGDYPVAELGGSTILQAAAMPNTRAIAAAGIVRLVNTAPSGMYPGSDVANMGLLGYNAAENYTGRAPIEAAGAGLPMQPADVAFRCNLVTVEGGRMADYSAGHITTDEGRALVATLDRELGRPGLRFHGGVSYRHLVLWKGGPANLKTEPPHEIPDRDIGPYLPHGERADEVRALMDASKPLFAAHPVNGRRVAAKLRPASQIWLWGQGRSMALPSYKSRFGLSGGVVTAVDLVRGIGVLAGLSAPRVEGATGFLDTNYAGKVAAALDILKQGDFAYVHVEAPDECGHIGDWKKKLQAVGDFDRNIVGPIWKALERSGEPYRLVVSTDHRTPVAVKSHTPEPVPLAVLQGPVGNVTAEAAFDEFVGGGQAQANTWEWIPRILDGSKPLG
jgi:2,3-bisphosphoglycerate-independent phosphoglycerate mutase